MTRAQEPAQETLSGNQANAVVGGRGRRPSKGRRRLLGGVCTLALCAVFLVWWSGRPSCRWFMNRSLGAMYGVCDPFSQPSSVSFGPTTADDGSLPVSNALERSLGEWFPGYSFQVEVSDTASPIPAEVVFRHENLDGEGVQRFRQNAQTLLAGSPSIFDLAQRTRAMTEHGAEALPAAGTDPIAYLQFSQEHRRLTCRYFAVIFEAGCVVQGYTARLLGLSRFGKGDEHAVVEVYVPDQKKWVLVDPDFNVAYRRGTVWLDGRQLHETWVQLKRQFGGSDVDAKQVHHAIALQKDAIPRLADVELVFLGDAGAAFRQSNLRQGSCTGMGLEYFEYVAYSARNDYLGGYYPKGHPDRSRQYVLQETPENGLPDVYYDGYPLRDIEDMYWSVGRSSIAVRPSDKNDGLALAVSPYTWTPNFSHFEIRENPTAWETVRGEEVEWRLRPGDNRLELRSVNRAGLRGETYWIAIRVAALKPAQARLGG